MSCRVWRLGLLWLVLMLGIAGVSGCGRDRQAEVQTDLSAVDAQPFAGASESPRIAELRGTAQGSNVVICVIDAARADHVGCYGYSRDTTPTIDRLAEQGLLFEHHFCQHPSTKQSTASLFTSQHPDTHLANGDRMLNESTFTLARGLQSAGFRTVLFSQNPYASPAAGIGNDFQEAYHDSEFLLERPENLLVSVSEWLAENRESQFFMYVHLLPPHRPYDAPAEMKRLFAGGDPPGSLQGDFQFPEVAESLPESNFPPLPEWVNLYDANLRYADWAVSELETLLREAGVFENTLFIVTSDHGEAFGEHGYEGHNNSVYDETIHIPLVIRWPGQERPTERMAALTQTIDILPTLFELYGVSYDSESVQGKSLLPLIVGEVDAVNQCIFARSGGRRPSYMVRDLHWSLLLYQSRRMRALYDLDSDPRQASDVYAAKAYPRVQLLGEFQTFIKTQVRQPYDFINPTLRPGPLPEAPVIEMSEETRRSLRALGYLR